MILPIGPPVWIAIAACPAVGRSAWAGDGHVVSHLPCSPCWQTYLGDGRRIRLADVRAAGQTCREPSGFIVRSGHARIAVTPDDSSVLVVPIAQTDTPRSAA